MAEPIREPESHGHRCVLCGHLCVLYCQCPEGLAARTCENQPPGMRSKECMELVVKRERERLDAESAVTAEEWRRKVEEAKERA